jgi:cyanophycinase
MFRKLPAFGFLSLWLMPLAFCQPPAPVVKLPCDEIRGTLVIHGGGAVPDDVRDEFIKLAGGPGAKLVVIPTASAAADGANANKALEPWNKYKLAALTLLHTRDRQKANDPAFVKPLTEATAVWLGGGNQSKLTEAYAGTAVAKELQKLLDRGGVLGGTSAGAAVMSQVMITDGKVEAKIGKGFGFLSHAVVDQHFLKRDRQKRLVGVLANHPGLFGLGVDEETTAIVRGRTVEVRGKSVVVTILSAGADRPLLLTKLKPGDKADLIALSRAAIARTQPPWPPEKAPVPSVPKGTLIIGGGGNLPNYIWQQFVDSAGGPDASIVYIPTALEDPIAAEPGEVKRLKAAGAKSVKILHTRKRSEADKEEFLAELQKAKGVWFSGGRQWRFVDAYLDTKAQKEFHGVLDRGGVIGGSSAGASIQADYMVRGDPLGNLKPMAEGYQRGLAFLQGVAIDQHFFKRKREADMTAVMKAHPQLLGIGIDEQTAIVVRGEVMEVVGLSKVAMYDRSRPIIDGQPDYEVLTAGMRYDLKARKLIEKVKGPTQPHCCHGSG